jgi:predicted nucleic acid-binding protein
MAPVVIFDTDILIDYLLGIPEAKAFWASIPSEDRYTTAISMMEIYRGARNNREITLFKRFFLTSFAEVIAINENASKKAVELIEVYTLSHGLLLADGLIAAIVLLRGCRLVTGNGRHFAYIPDIDLLIPPYRSSGS